jgi:hypothetical protein
MEGLTTKQQDLCGYSGTFGALISLTCIVQHIIITTGHWITFVMLAMYLFVMASFILLAFQKNIAPGFLVVSCIFAFLTEGLLVLSGVISVAVILLFIYTLIITIVIFMEQVPKGLKEKALLLKAEEDSWAGKI